MHMPAMIRLDAWTPLLADTVKINVDACWRACSGAGSIDVVVRNSDVVCLAI